MHRAGLLRIITTIGKYFSTRYIEPLQPDAALKSQQLQFINFHK